MESSILNSIKKLRGIDVSYTHFDTDMIICINTALAQLTQVGVGDSSGFVLSDASQKWKSFTKSDDTVLLSLIKMFVDKKVCLMFDPPTNGTVMEANNKILDELLFRIYVQIHNKGVS